MKLKLPYVLTIAGHDPCAGAGLTSDIKTFEHHAVYGLSAVSAITIQNDFEFKNVNWVEVNLIKEQIDVLFKTYPISVVKIGLIESFEVLTILIKHLKRKNNVRIIWDPILKSSSGFGFHNTKGLKDDMLSQLFLITPNAEEYKLIKQGVKDIKVINYLLKGGHSEDHRGTDILWQDGKEIRINGESFEGKSKHGTGCVLSSAIAANLAKGIALQEACKLAKKYVEAFILSTDNNLGIHQ